MNMFGMKKIKIFDMDGSKLDTALVSSKKEAKSVFDRWEKKGLF